MTKTFLAWVRGLPFWRPPHPAQPTQASLQKLLADVRRVQVRARGISEGRSLSERILFVTDLPKDIQALGEALRIEDGSAEQCLCMLDTSILLFDGADRQLAAIGVHTCHRAIHWDHWKDDARLVDSWQLIDWRSSHGVPTFVSDDRIRERSLNRISDFLGASLERVARAIYSTADRGTSLTLAVSSRRPDASFHFAFRSDQQTVLQGAVRAYAAFACGSPHRVLLVPFSELASWLAILHPVTVSGGDSFWPIRVMESPGGLLLQGLPVRDQVDLRRFLLAEHP